MPQIEAIRMELASDPATYDPLPNEEVADLLNLVDGSITRERDSMTADEVLQNIDLAELDALTADKRADVDLVLSLDSIDPFGKAQALMVAAFTGGSLTITALAAARIESISRAQDIGLDEVKPGHVLNARAG